MRPVARPDYSYRQDRAVPRFDESRLLLVMDGECALCSGAARRIARWDRRDQVRIATVQSHLGRGLLLHYGMQPDDPESWLMIENGRASGSLDAIITLGPRLHWALKPLLALRLLPFGAQDWLYARLARNRYAMFGKADICALPDPELQRRVIAQ